MTVKSRWEQYKEKNGVTPLDLLSPQTIQASEEKSKYRHEICMGCENHVHITDQCKKCGCFMKIKTKLDAAKCPIGKW